MFCKYCDKEISNDSQFCKYCGKSIAENENIDTLDEPAKTNDVVSSSEVHNCEGKTDTDVSSDQTIATSGSRVADEVVANIKMIGWAILVWAIYLGCFYVYHLNDIKELKMDSYDSYWGESCYDPGIMSGGGEMNPKEIYKRLRFYRDHPGQYYYGGFGDVQESTRSTETVPDEYKDDPLYQQAVDEANRNKQAFLDEINSIRKYGFEDDFKKHALWSGLISLFLFVIGRYIILSFKWVDKNRTK